MKKQDDMFDAPTEPAAAPAAVAPPEPANPYVFEMPPARIPRPEPAGAEPVGDWNELPGRPDTPVMRHTAGGAPLGYCAGGKIRFTLCRPNAAQGAAGCTNYNAGADQCTGSVAESWRRESTECMNYRSRDGG